MHAARRNKQLAIAAGHHCIVFRFGPEGHLMRFTRKDFDEIISVDVPGTNKNKSKAARLRSFKVPKRFFVDFARLVQMHVVSIGRHFVKGDMQAGSAMWPRLWDGFQTGPDWLLEFPLVINALDLWRDEVRTRRLHTPLIDALCDPAIFPFNAFDRHTANDAAHGMGVFPNTPVSAFVQDDRIFAQFTHSLQSYLAQFDSQQFLKAMVSLPNTDNPAALYNFQLRNGLRDENHTIGQPYLREIAPEELAANYKEVKVVYYRKPYDSFTTILAKVPDDWAQLAVGGYKPVPGPIRDIRTSGYQTAVGVADFRENKLNMRDIKRSVAALSVAGRKGKMENINEQCCVPAIEESSNGEDHEDENEDEDGDQDEDDEDDYGNDDEIEIENMEYVPSEDNKVSTNLTALCTPVLVFDGDNQAQPIAKSARTAHRFTATSSVASGSSAPSARRTSRRASTTGAGQKRSASPEGLEEFAVPRKRAKRV
ncbi:hypothetical protein GGG16DRAFT_114408 [Schizophyllum commune]